MINQSTTESNTEKTPGFHQRLLLRLQRLGIPSWQVWAALLIVFSGGIGFIATSMLLKLPSAPNCPRIFWPIASASLRLYCAEIDAEKGTVEHLLRAIALVEALPSDHPLRSEINRKVEEWSTAILNLADKDFQAGKLNEAIATARKIPSNVQAYKLVEEKVEGWQSIWEEGEKISADVEQQLKESNWIQAFRVAIQLLNLDNQYWATTKYDETVKKIQLAKEESSKLDEAYSILRRGGLDNWLKAIEEAKKIPASSYAHYEAQNLIQKAKDKLFSYVERLIENSLWQELQQVAERIPETIGLTQEVSDWKTLATAGSDAQQGTPESMQSAITIAEQIGASSPVYESAQKLLSRWKLEIEDVAHLAQARNLAEAGTIEGLNGAISEAGLIPESNPRYQEAQKEVSSWRSKIEVIEDQPLLNRAQDLARSGTINDLQQAIAQANTIRPERSLYREAQSQIQQWQNQVEQQEDQPLLDQAIALANGDDYQGAVTTAEQIGRGRFLYREARGKIRGWRREIEAQDKFRQAYSVAEAQTPDALITAITIVRKIPSSTQVGSQKLEVLNRWSFQLLAMATERANASLLQEAIALAQTIPSESSAYSSAQSQIAVWKTMLEPATEQQPTPSVEDPGTINNEQ